MGVISLQAIDLLHRLLAMDHTKRRTAAETLKHEWFADTRLDAADAELQKAAAAAAASAQAAMAAAVESDEAAEISDDDGSERNGEAADVEPIIGLTLGGSLQGTTVAEEEEVQRSKL